jgi:hypothetical protein
VARDVAVQMCDTLAGTDYVGVVNVSYMAMANEPAMQPYLQLGEMIGKLHSQTVSGKVNNTHNNNSNSNIGHKPLVADN